MYLPNVNYPVPEAIQNNPKWWSFFHNVLGAIDGPHINCTPSAQDVHSACNCKGGVTQNCLAVVSFQMRFLLFISGWDGCAADATMYAKETSVFHLENAIWLMLDLAYVMHYLCHIMVCDIIWQNGVVQISSEYGVNY